jgi:hypothetical protein
MHVCIHTFTYMHAHVHDLCASDSFMSWSKTLIHTYIHTYIYTYADVSVSFRSVPYSGTFWSKSQFASLGELIIDLGMCIEGINTFSVSLFFFVYASLRDLIHGYIHTHIYTYVHVHFTYVHTYILTHTHTCVAWQILARVQ